MATDKKCAATVEVQTNDPEETMSLFWILYLRSNTLNQTQGFYHKEIVHPIALRMRLLRRSALQNDGLDVPVILQCRTPQETNPKGHWVPNYFLINPCL
jgi:hypothetical protein